MEMEIIIMPIHKVPFTDVPPNTAPVKMQVVAPFEQISHLFLIITHINEPLKIVL